MTRILRALAATLAMATLSAASTAAQPLSFEAASVRPNNSGGTAQNISRQPGGRFSVVNVALRQLIIFAYQIQPYQLVGGPGWVSDTHFDIVAKLEGDPPPSPIGAGPDHMMLALRTLLAERFKLILRRETRELDIYALTLARRSGTGILRHPTGRRRAHHGPGHSVVGVRQLPLESGRTLCR